MPPPFRVRDQDTPGIDLGGWGEDGSIDIPGTLTATGGIITPVGGWDAADSGFKAWAFDPNEMQGATILVSQSLYLVRIPIRRAFTCTNIHISIGTAGATLTAAQSLVGLIDATSGARLGISADQSVDWAANTGLRPPIPLTSPVALSAGYVYGAVLCNGTTPITPERGSTRSPSGRNQGLMAAAQARWAVNGTAQTTIPTTNALASNDVTALALGIWLGLS